LFKTIDRVSEIDPLSDIGEVPSSCAGRIQIENVDFAYPTRKDMPVLLDFSLSVPANSTTALVGQSGSGKSTIVGLLGEFASFVLR
jgi:ATP-binding cassette subfamily B (MDR/TAP) protein 1